MRFLSARRGQQAGALGAEVTGHVSRHRWSDGDLVVWDNRCVQHYAIHDYGEEPRLLHRITIRGDRPS